MKANISLYFEILNSWDLSNLAREKVSQAESQQFISNLILWGLLHVQD